MAVVTVLHGSYANMHRNWNLAIVPEAYTKDELAQFARDADRVVKALLATPAIAAFAHLINIVRVDIPSASSGRVLTQRCPWTPPPGYSTAFSAQFCQGGVERVVSGDSQLVIDTVRGHIGLGGVDHFLVIVNSTLDGGVGPNPVGWFSTAGDTWPATAVHELGHAAFGLADEYDYATAAPNEQPAVYGGTEPSTPNVTTGLTRGAIKWGFLIDPSTPLPTTVPRAAGQPCVFGHPARTTALEAVVGAFEGATQTACGAYRPAFRCRMRHSPDAFCAWCDSVVRSRLGNLSLGVRPDVTAAVGDWTHIAGVPLFGDASLFLYQRATGDIAWYRCFPLMFVTGGNIVPAGARLDADWTSLAPFALGDQWYLLAHRFGDGRRAIYRLDPPVPVKVWEDAGPGLTWTHVTTIDIAGHPHAVSYNTLTGQAAVERLEPAAQEPTPVAAQAWAPGWSAVAAFALGGVAYALAYQWVTTRVRMWPLFPSAATPAPWEATNLWSRGASHVAAFARDGVPFVLRYSSLDGRAHVCRPRTNGQGIDTVCERPFGVGGLSILGVGAPAFSAFELPNQNPKVLDPFRYLAFYNQRLGRVAFWSIS